MSKTYSYIVEPGQNLVDVAMQEYGSAEAVVEICNENNFDVGQAITAGAVLKMDEANIKDKRLVKYYKDKQIIVATE